MLKCCCSCRIWASVVSSVFSVRPCYWFKNVKKKKKKQQEFIYLTTSSHIFTAMTAGCPQVTLKETLRSCLTSKGLGGLVWKHIGSKIEKNSITHLITLVTEVSVNMDFLLNRLRRLSYGNFYQNEILVYSSNVVIHAGSPWLGSGYRRLQWVDEWGRLLCKWKEHTCQSAPEDSSSRRTGGWWSLFFFN